MMVDSNISISAAAAGRFLTATLLLIAAAAACFTTGPVRAEENRVIAVLGTGRVGNALGPRFAELGMRVIYGSREPQREDVQALVEKTGENASAASSAEAASQADIIVIATPFRAMDAVLSELSGLSDKIIIDVSNALAPTEDGLMAMAGDQSAGEAFQQALPGCQV
ncbi:MAG: NAD(P)-binding domain-containing protein, partial [Pseudomonadota bacterium]